MAGASVNDIKARMKSINSTMQITKAMELVATSKLRRAGERAESSRPYRRALNKAMESLCRSDAAEETVWCSDRQIKKRLIIVIAGDRGLAGGYNANIFRLAKSLSEKEEDTVYLPIGKKSAEHYRGRHEVFCFTEDAADMGVGSAMQLSGDICSAFAEGKFGEVYLVYTEFISMLQQLPRSIKLLPLQRSADRRTNPPESEGEAEEFSEAVVHSYVGGIIHCALCEAVASESGARRSAMNSANKNAEEMIDALTVKYNRARQAVITQEITEIVSGAEAL